MLPTYEQIVSRIQGETGIPYSEIQEKVRKKIEQLSDMVSREGAAHIVANELGVKIFDIGRKVKIGELNAMMRNIEVVSKVIKRYETRQFKSPKTGREGIVCSLLIGDDTGSARLVIWNEKQIKEIEQFGDGTVIKVNNAYTKNNNGFMEIHLSNSSEILAENAEIEVKPLVNAKKKIIDLQENTHACIVGIVTRVFEPRVYEACAECGKKLDAGICREHGNVEKKIVPVVNLYFDDGSDMIRVCCFRENAEAVLGMEAKDIMGLDPERFKDVQRDVAGKQLEISGRVVKNLMFDRLELNANEVKEANPSEIMAGLSSETIVGS